MRAKIVDWIKRYLPAEISGTVGAVVGGLVLHVATSNTALVALGGVWGENVGYYSTILLSDIVSVARNNKPFKLRNAYLVLRNIFVEFGFSEVLDTFVTRPLLLYAFVGMIDNVPAGLIIGKLGADVAFYSITILMYECRKKYLRN